MFSEGFRVFLRFTRDFLGIFWGFSEGFWVFSEGFRVLPTALRFSTGFLGYFLFSLAAKGNPRPPKPSQMAI